MSFKFEKDKFYMQPVFFGPTTTMQNMQGERILHQPADVECLGVSFETNPDQIVALLPEGFTSNEPVVRIRQYRLACGTYLQPHKYLYAGAF